jgi:hypothetical protein
MLMQRCASSVADVREEARLCGLGSVDDGAPVLEDCQSARAEATVASLRHDL